MATHLTTKGLFLGITAGLLVTLWDGLFMLTPNKYVPLSYPLLLITFNPDFAVGIVTRRLKPKRNA
jgi:hypothetical protein